MAHIDQGISSDDDDDELESKKTLILSITSISEVFILNEIRGKNRSEKNNPSQRIKNTSKALIPVWDSF